MFNKLELTENQAIIMQLELLLIHLPGAIIMQLELLLLHLPEGTPFDVPVTVERAVS